MKENTNHPDLQLSEAEVLQLTQSVNLLRTEQMIFEKIGEIPVSVAPGKGWKPKRRLKQTLLLIAALVLCVGCSAVAYQQGYFEALFGSGVNSAQVIRVAESQESGGIRMTLTDMVYGRTEAMAIMAFEQENGQAFPDRIEFVEVKASDGKQPNGFELDGRGNLGNLYLVDDNSTLLYYFELYKGEEPLKGQTLSVKAQGLVATKTEELDFPLDLAAFDGDFSDDAEPIPLPLSKEYPEIRFAGAGFEDGLFKLAVSIPGFTEAMSATDNALRKQAYIAGLKDSRTGETHVFSLAGPTPAFQKGEEVSFVTGFDGIGREDLPYLTPVITYEFKELISDGQWSFSYVFEEDGLTVTQSLDLTFTNVFFPGEPNEEIGGLVRLTEMNLSAFSFILSGEWLGDDPHGQVPFSKPDVALRLKDGTEIALIISGGGPLESGADFKLRYAYPPLTEKGTFPQFIDQAFIDHLESVVINGDLILLK